MLIDKIRRGTRHGIRKLAIILDSASAGRLTPNMVTAVGVAMHIPIAFLVAAGSFGWAAVLLVIFGLFDVLDGELARLQKRADAKGMLYDATTDRVKEVLLYAGIAAYLSTSVYAGWTFWAVIACGASITVSYAKAKGEAALALKRTITDHHALNRHFKEGLVPFEIRMAIIVAGLLFDQILAATVLIAMLATLTLITRLQIIGKQL